MHRRGFLFAVVVAVSGIGCASRNSFVCREWKRKEATQKRCLSLSGYGFKLVPDGYENGWRKWRKVACL